MLETFFAIFLSVRCVALLHKSRKSLGWATLLLVPVTGIFNYILLFNPAKDAFNFLSNLEFMF